MTHNQAYLEAEKKIEQALKSGATELVLSNDYNAPDEKKLTELPESIGKLKQLTSLKLSYNKLTTLPEWLGQLTQLQELNLSNNQLTTLPGSLGQLTQLQSLTLSYNQLTALPDSLGQLSQLRILDLYKTQLRALPEWIGQLMELQELNIGNNPLSMLPSTFFNLKQLREIVIHKQPRLVSQLDQIYRISQLEKLFLNDNKITDLPSSLAKLEYLDYLELGDNPLNPALQSAYKSGQDAVKAYLRSLENAEPLYEAKLVLVGEGNVGKTTLLKALKGKKGKKAPKKDETTTHGVEIDIHGLLLPHPTKKKVKIQLNAWDFGGQDVYRVTHQFFFSRRSLYLLVWEPRRGVQAGQVEDWLNMIRLRVGNDARVLIVSTHCETGERIARIDKPVLQQQYGEMIVGFYEVDSLVPDEQTGEMVGIVALKRSLPSRHPNWNKWAWASTATGSPPAMS